MTEGRPTPDGEAPRPVLGGCLGMLLVAVLLVGMATFVLIYLDSGADRGQLALRDYRSYEEGSVEYVGDRNLWLVRFSDGGFVALDDLDRANRGARGERCRVQIVGAEDRRLPEMLDDYQGSFSERARGLPFLFHESCNGAVYDADGHRLDEAGPNLDRYRVGRREETGQLVVDVSERICSEPRGDEDFARVQCPN